MVLASQTGQAQARRATGLPESRRTAINKSGVSANAAEPAANRRFGKSEKGAYQCAVCEKLDAMPFTDMAHPIQRSRVYDGELDRRMTCEKRKPTDQRSVMSPPGFGR